MKRWLVPLLVAASAGAHAQPSAASPMSDEARAYLDRGEALYKAGEYVRAIAEFDAGQRIEAHPDFHYAKGQAYRKLGDCPRAVASYQAFLATRPPEEEAARAHANIERCPVSPPQEAPAQPAQQQQQEQPSPPRAAWYRDRLGGVLAGAGTLGLAVGTTYLVLGDRSVRSANAAGSLAQLEELGATARRERTSGAVCLAVGGALAVGAAVRYALVGRRERASSASRSARAISLSPQPSAIVLSWGGWF
jgi:tetratricopeptide (TPR) repeat protein